MKDEHNDPIDGMITDPVGEQVQMKHELLRKYIAITAPTRKMFIGKGKAGATFIDLFCGSGRSRIRDTDTWKDGSAQVAWSESVVTGSPFTQMFVADIRENARNACLERLVRDGAPAKALVGTALEAVEQIISSLHPNALHVVFIDPYSLRALDFRILEKLSKLKRVDLVIHVSVMDLQRNLDKNLTSPDSDLDYFCPGWRSVIDTKSGKFDTRSQIIDFWRKKVRSLGIGASTQMRLISGAGGQRLYWLLIAAKHELAERLWKVVTNTDGQGELF